MVMRSAVTPLHLAAICFSYFHSSSACTLALASLHHSFHLLASSIPSANVPTLASIAYPSSSNLLHSAYRSFSGVENTSINSFSSNSGFKFWFSGFDISTVTCTMFRFVLQKPGSAHTSAQVHTYKYQTCKAMEAHTIKHNRTNLCRNTHVPRLLLQLPHRALRRILPSIHQPSRHLYHDFVYGRPKLLLQ